LFFSLSVVDLDVAGMLRAITRRDEDIAHAGVAILPYAHLEVSRVGCRFFSARTASITGSAYDVLACIFALAIFFFVAGVSIFF